MLWDLYPVIHVLLEICDFFYFGMKSQERASGSYPTFCSSGKYLGLTLNSWVPQANVLQLSNSTWWDYSLKVCCKLHFAQKYVSWVQCRVHTMGARPTLRLGSHAWFLLMKLLCASWDDCSWEPQLCWRWPQNTSFSVCLLFCLPRCKGSCLNLFFQSNVFLLGW